MKKTTIALLLLFSIGLSAFAQPTEKQLQSDNYQDLKVPLQETSEEFSILEEEPMYPGGLQGLMQDLVGNIKYPKSARKQGVAGVVVLHFVIERDGSVGDVEVVKSVHPDLDAAAVNAVKQLRMFYPGKAGGKFIRVRYTLPVRFALE